MVQLVHWQEPNLKELEESKELEEEKEERDQLLEEPKFDFNSFNF